ncbi:MAG: hypothetical protein ACI4NJ_07320 [Cellvibrio sp.]
MIQLITLIILVTVFVLVLRNLQNAPVAARRRGYWRLGIAVTLFILFFLIITGRMHWVGALLGLLLPLGKLLFHIIAERYISRSFENKAAPEESKSSSMSLDEARAILGVSLNASREDIESVYKTLMQKLHPDRGGNDYLAAQLNRARDRLLEELDQTA